MVACLESQAHAFVGACFGQQRCQKNEGDESESKNERGGDKKTEMRKERVEKEKETISAQRMRRKEGEKIKFIKKQDTIMLQCHHTLAL